jgi:hypothetical protein
MKINQYEANYSTFPSLYIPDYQVQPNMYFSKYISLASFINICRHERSGISEYNKYITEI